MSDTLPDEPSEKRYQHTQSWYVERYAKSLATIKRWWAKGYPLDDPDAMGEYLSPRGRKADEPEEYAFTPREPEPVGDDSLIQLDESFFRGRGVLAAIERLQKAERERAAAYFDAIRKGAAILIQNRFKEWLGIVEALRKLEKDAPEIRKLNALTLDASEAEAAWSQVLQAFNTSLNTLPHRAAEKLQGLSDYEEVVEVLEKEVAGVRRTLIAKVRSAQEAARQSAEIAAQDEIARKPREAGA